MFRTCIVTLSCLGALVAQSSSAVPQPPAVAPAAFQLTEPVFDAAADGTLLVAGPGYRARFDRRGAEFTPFLGSDAERAWPVSFVLAGAAVGGVDLPVAAATPERCGRLVTFARGAADELYELRADGAEQRFVFRSLPARGELCLRIDVDSDLRAEEVADGVLFAGPRGGVHYGLAVAIDAHGERVAMTTYCVDGALELRVPAEFVAAAALPLVVDPLIQPRSMFRNGTTALGNLDLAYDASVGEWIAVWDAAFHANNYDVYAQRLGAGANPIGGAIVVEAGATSWRKPRIANLPGGDNFLVVAEADDVASSPWIQARKLTIANNSVSLGTHFDIARSGQNGAPIGSFTNPDVGGDGVTIGYWNVVYEYGAAPDRDIHMRLVGPNGNLVGAQATLLAATAYDERGPRVSKSNGGQNTPSQTWGVLWERRVTLGNGAGDFSKVWGALVTWNGSQRSLLGQTSWPVFDTAVEGRGGYDISSPTDEIGGQRYLMAVESRPTATEGHNLFGMVFSHQGLGGAAVDLMHVTSLPFVLTSKDQHSPAIDCDGTRFALTFTHDFSATDTDAYIATYARSPAGAIVAHEAPIVLGNTTEDEDGTAICSRRSDGGEPGRYLAGLHMLVGTDHQLRAEVYEGLAPGGITWRGSGCGSLVMTAANEPGLGMPVAFHLAGVTGLGGYLAGLPANTAPTPCPNCTMGTTGDVTLLGSNWTFLVPNNTGIVGVTVAVQGFEIGSSGPCLGQIRASNTADLTIR